MRIDWVEFENFRQHTALRADLGAGMIGVVGPNGSGKSNFVKGILRGLTGDTGDPGKNEDDITDFRDKGFIRVGFNVNGIPGVIKRQLKTSGCQLKFGSDIDLKSSTEIAKKLYGILGVSSKVLTEMIFIEQGKLEGVLFQTPSDRAKSFQVLFGTENAERIRDMLDVELKQIVAEDREASIKTLEAELSSGVMPALAKVEESMKATSAMPADLFEACKEIVSAYEAQARAAESTARARSAVLQLEESIKEYRIRRAQLTGKHKITEDVILSLNDEYKPACIRIADYSAALLRAKNRASLQLVIDKSKIALAVPPPPDAGVTREEIEKKRVEHNVMWNELQLCEKILNNLTGAATCPTCSQPVDQNFVKEKKQYREHMTQPARELYEQLSTDEQHLQTFVRVQATWKANQVTARDNLDLATAQLMSMPTETIQSPESHRVDLDMKNDYESYVRTKEQLEQELRTIAMSLKTFEQQLQSARSAVTGAGAGELISEAEYKSAKERLDKNDKMKLETATLTGRYAELSERKKTLIDQIEKHKGDMLKMAPIKAWKELLERSRLILHRDQLPAMVTRAFLKPLNESLNHYLKLFQIPFTCVINADQTIDCIFTNGAQRSAMKLSGGQKVAMGIAFRFAVYDKFARNLGFLVLDEPTPYLDDQRREGVLDLLMSVKSYSRQAGLQVIVVTHDKTLLPAFDKIIEFREPIYTSKEAS